MNKVQYPHFYNTVKNLKSDLMKLVLTESFVVILVFGSTDSFAQVQQPTLLALSKNNHTLAIVNSVSLEVISHIDVGPGPDGVAWAVQH
jgi:hypothetical protein